MFFNFYTMFVSSLHRARGRADIGLYLATIVLVLSVIGLPFAAEYGLVGVSIVWVGRLFAILPIVVLILRWLLREPVWVILQPALAPLLASGVMAAGVMAIAWELDGRVPTIVLLAVATGVGAVIYALTLWSLSPELMRHTVKTLRAVIHPTGSS
jgi:hypothetical protein